MWLYVEWILFVCWIVFVRFGVDTPIKVGLGQFIDNEPFYSIAFLNTNRTVWKYRVDH